MELNFGTGQVEGSVGAREAAEVFVSIGQGYSGVIASIYVPGRGDCWHWDDVDAGGHPDEEAQGHIGEPGAVHESL